MFDEANFKVSAFKNFDLPIVDALTVHDKISIVVFVDSNRGGDGDSSILIVFEVKTLIAIVRFPIEVNEVGIHQ